MALVTLVPIPHFDFPVRFTKAGPIAVVEQDSVEEIEACVAVILTYRVGDRAELPQFGIPDPTFEQGGADPAPILAAVQQWEPRAQAAAEAVGLSLGEFVDTVSVEIQSS